MTTTRYMTVGEGRIAFEDTGGSGMPILLVPGMGDLKGVYRFITDDLNKRGFRVITMDLRGMGDSSARWKDYSESSIALDIVTLINKLDLKSVVLVGNSISAGSSIIASAKHPGLITKLVLISPFARNVPISHFKLFLFRLAIVRPWGPWVWANYQSSILYPSVKPPDMETYRYSIRKMLFQKGRMKAFQKMAATNHDKAQENIEKLKVPTMVVMGSKDPDFPNPKNEMDWLAERIGAKTLMIEGAGHYPQAEYPEEFIKCLINFIGEGSVS